MSTETWATVSPVAPEMARRGEYVPVVLIGQRDLVDQRFVTTNETFGERVGDMAEQSIGTVGRNPESVDQRSTCFGNDLVRPTNVDQIGFGDSKQKVTCSRAHQDVRVEKQPLATHDEIRPL